MILNNSARTALHVGMGDGELPRLVRVGVGVPVVPAPAGSRRSWLKKLPSRGAYPLIIAGPVSNTFVVHTYQLEYGFFSTCMDCWNHGCWSEGVSRHEVQADLHTASVRRFEKADEIRVGAVTRCDLVEVCHVITRVPER